MKQFDVYRNPDAKAARIRPYVVILQSDFLSIVETVVVAPLASAVRAKPIVRLTPLLDVAGVQYAIYVHDMAAIPRALLKRKVVSAAAKRDEIVAALDLVFHGF